MTFGAAQKDLHIMIYNILSLLTASGYNINQLPLSKLALMKCKKGWYKYFDKYKVVCFSCKYMCYYTGEDLNKIN